MIVKTTMPRASHAICLPTNTLERFGIQHKMGHNVWPQESAELSNAAADDRIVDGYRILPLTKMDDLIDVVASSEDLRLFLVSVPPEEAIQQVTVAEPQPLPHLHGTRTYDVVKRMTIVAPLDPFDIGTVKRHDLHYDLRFAVLFGTVKLVRFLLEERHVQATVRAVSSALLGGRSDMLRFFVEHHPNLWRSVKKTVKQWVVGCLDPETIEYAMAEGMPVYVLELVNLQKYYDLLGRTNKKARQRKCSKVMDLLLSTIGAQDGIVGTLLGLEDDLLFSRFANQADMDAVMGRPIADAKAIADAYVNRGIRDGVLQLIDGWKSA